NEGLRALDQRPAGPVAFVQFVDGDCEVEAGWLDTALRELRAQCDVAVVFGRRRERERSASRYNRLCDLEWDVPTGDVLSCGGDALMRADAVRACGGYDANRIAGEEPELCLRLRAAGWRIRCVAVPMTVHDAAMHRFGQWWSRALRAGYVEAEGLAAHGWSYPRRRSALAGLFWAFAVPVLALAAIGWFLVAGRTALAATVTVGALLLYAASWLRTMLRARGRWPSADAALWATSCLLAKWPATCGMAVYWWRRVTGGNRRLIEYKQASPR
ncbi:MAG: glycosyltransferase family 2 protein, partial [Planctomycetota bacterium]